MKDNIVVLGATGSVGQATLDVIRRHPDRFRLWAVSGFNNIERLAQIVCSYRPQVVILKPGSKKDFIRHWNGRNKNGDKLPEIISEAQGLEEIVRRDGAGSVVAAISGAAGLPSLLSAVSGGKRVLIANKEPLVMMGAQLLMEADRSGAMLLPVDSEHNAIFQCLPVAYQKAAMFGQLGRVKRAVADADRRSIPANVSGITLTASGGPFLNAPIKSLNRMSPSQAANHPNWKMGRKISIDSATMMNKCLELIEACSYFALPPSAVDIVIHPQSIVHSLVTFEDNSVVAQMAVADMRIPIANALAYPDRIVSGADTLDLCAIGRLDFLHPDEARFPCIAVARDVATIGGTAPAIMNAANEVAVELFCQGKIRFTDIVPMIEKTVSRMPHEPIAGVDHVLEVDQRARAVTRKLLGQKTL